MYHLVSLSNKRTKTNKTLSRYAKDTAPQPSTMMSAVPPAAAIQGLARILLRAALTASKVGVSDRISSGVCTNESKNESASGHVKASQCQHEATNQYNAAPPSALNADTMASGARELSMRLMYEAAVGSDKEWVADTLATHKFDSRAKLEATAYAYACVLCRLSDDDDVSQMPIDVPTNTTQIDPLTDEQMLAAAHAIKTSERTRSVYARLLTFSVCCVAMKRSIKWSDFKNEADEATRGRLIRYLKRAAETCTWKFGDGYIENRIRTILPGWSVCCTPKGLTPYDVVTELMFDDANDVVRGILNTPIASNLRDFKDPRHGITALFAAVAILQESTGGKPKLLVNTDILRHTSDDEPAVAVAFNLEGLTRVGLITGNVVDYSSRWTAPCMDVLIEILIAGRDLGVSAFREIASAIIDNDTTSPAYAFISA